jgi:Family of unknown function (DUF6527)
MKVGYLEYTPGIPVIKCPGCGHYHYFNPPDQPTRGGAKWEWNGNRDRPTFAPSMLETVNPPGHPAYVPEFPTSVCHSWVRDGRIEFLADCTHAHAGKTMDLPDWEERGA